MNKKIGLGIGIVIIAILALVTWRNSASTPAPATNEPTQQQNTVNTPAQTEPGENEVETFTAAEVATHATTDDCYAIISGKVYNLTAWISKHPGGPEAIKGICGTDATEVFSAQHGTSQQPNDALAMFLIGEVVK